MDNPHKSFNITITINEMGLKRIKVTAPTVEGRDLGKAIHECIKPCLNEIEAIIEAMTKMDIKEGKGLDEQT